MMRTMRHLKSTTYPLTSSELTTTSSSSLAASSDTKHAHGSLNFSSSNNQDMNITYSSTARCKKTMPHHHHHQQQQLHLRTMLAVAIVVLLGLMQTTVASPVFVDNPSLAQFQSGRNIRHLPCIVRKSGRSGVCMFAIDCIKQNGTHLGTCIDRFYFGSCCQMKEESPLYAPEIIDNSIDQNTISHFVHESTTLPTSTLFKLTTESLNHVHSSSSHSGSELLKNLTQSYTSSNKVDPTTTTLSGKPIKEMPSKRPPSHTTHKSSQFVVRTTARPSSTLKTTVTPTTVKPTRRKTTTAAPILTTAAQLEQRIDTTTLPTKFFTFQIVETTTPTVTEPTHIERQTTHRPISSTRRPKPTVDNLVTLNTTVAATTSAVTTTNHTTTQATTPVRVTSKPKPIVTRRPVNTKKPTQNKRPVNKPTRKPVQNTTLETAKPELFNTTTSPIRKQPVTTIQSNTQTTVTETKPPKTSTQTTRAPRPRPKPTAEIVRVPKPTQGSTESTTTHSAPTTTTLAATATKKPSTQAATSSPPTVTKTKPKPSTTSTTTEPPTISTITSSTTKRPKTTTTAAAATTTATSTTTSKTTTHAPDTTEAPKADAMPILTTTTLKPGLVTWTNLDAEPVTNATTDEEWRPHPPPSDWVPVPTITPDTGTKVNVDTASSTTEEPTTASSTERIIVSISSSVSEIMNNGSHIISKPDKPITTLKPTTTAPITTKAPKPRPKPTENTSTSSTTTTTTTTSTTEAPIELDTSTNIDLTTDGNLGTGSTTMEYLTEDYNSTMGSTTPTPANSLEGVDYKQICGRRMFPEPRIVGGSNAAFGRWPWQISLRQWRTSTYLHKCGAALLNENWAITAAHCVDNVPPSDLLLRLGEYDLAEEQEPYGYQERRVQIVASHPQFDSRTFEYDLALLRFYEPIVFQPNIIPVCVPESDLDFIGQTAFVTGWGRLYEDGPLPSVLQEVAVPVINNTICESMYRSAGYIEHIPHIFICAGWKKGGYDSCEGDSGGPMVLQREEDKRFQLGGVISWGIGCAEANQPGVYTRISEFRDWINQILRF